MCALIDSCAASAFRVSCFSFSLLSKYVPPAAPSKRVASATTSSSSSIVAAGTGAAAVAVAWTPIPVSLVVGVPGAGHAAIVAAVHEHDSKTASAATAATVVGASSGATRWSTLVLGGGNEAFSLTSTSQAALQAVAQLRERVDQLALQSPTSPQRVVVIVSTYMGVADVVELLQSLLLHAPSSGSGSGSGSSSSSRFSFRLSTIVALLSCSSLFVGPSGSLSVAGVVDSLVGGYTGSCLLWTPCPPLSGQDQALVAAVRARIKSLHPAGRDLRVVTQGARIMFKQELQHMLTKDTWSKPAQIRRRTALRLLTSSIPRSPSASACSSGRAFLFHFSPSQFLFDRSNFLRSLAAFATSRAVYHSDEERTDEQARNQARLAKTMESFTTTPGLGSAASVLASSSAAAGASSSSSAGASGRIVFTTSLESLPSSYTVLGVVGLLKFEDAASNAGACSHNFWQLHASNEGRVTIQPRNFDNNYNNKAKAKEETKTEKQPAEEEEDDEFAERKESDVDPAVASSVDPSVSSHHAGCPIPFAALPLDIAQFLLADSSVLSSAPAAAAVASSSSPSAPTSLPSALSASSLTTASTSCLLLVYGCSSLSRSDVQRDLLLPSLRNARSYEKADSGWNTEVKRQQAAIVRE